LTQPSWEERCDALRAEIEHQNVARPIRGAAAAKRSTADGA
jgi:hypothetical protein